MALSLVKETIYKKKLWEHCVLLNSEQNWILKAIENQINEIKRNDNRDKSYYIYSYE